MVTLEELKGYQITLFMDDIILYRNNNHIYAVGVGGLKTEVVRNCNISSQKPFLLGFGVIVGNSREYLHNDLKILGYELLKEIIDLLSSGGISISREIYACSFFEHVYKHKDREWKEKRNVIQRLRGKLEEMGYTIVFKNNTTCSPSGAYDVAYEIKQKIGDMTKVEIRKLKTSQLNSTKKFILVHRNPI